MLYREQETRHDTRGYKNNAEHERRTIDATSFLEKQSCSIELYKGTLFFFFSTNESRLQFRYKTRSMPRYNPILTSMIRLYKLTQTQTLKFRDCFKLITPFSSSSFFFTKYKLQTLKKRVERIK